MGDVWPFVALGHTLERLGHSVIFALNRNEQFEYVGSLTVAPIGPLVKRQFFKQTLTEMNREEDIDAQWERFYRAMEFAVPGMYYDLTALSETIDAIICSRFCFAAHMVHEKTGIPLINISLVELEEWASGSKAGCAEIVNRCRESLGFTGMHDPFSNNPGSELLSIVAVSPGLTHLDPRRAPGFFYLPSKPFVPSQELEEFISDGEKPIVVTLGSMTPDDPGGLTAILVDAIGRCGRRALIQRGWGRLGMTTGLTPSHVKFIGPVPHEWLFAQTELVIHHSGAGTTAACLRSGVPSIQVPFLLDQHYWARLCMEFGSAVATIPMKDLSSDALAREITTALQHYDDYLDRARCAAAIICGEAGVAGAASMIVTAVEQSRLLVSNRRSL